MRILQAILFVYAGLSILGAMIISWEAGTWNLLLAAYLLPGDRRRTGVREETVQTQRAITNRVAANRGTLYRPYHSQTHRSPIQSQNRRTGLQGIRTKIGLGIRGMANIWTF
jgi:hypothetical protein